MVKLGRTKSERVLFLWLTGHGVTLSGTVMPFLPLRYRISVITHQAVTLYASIVTELLKREGTGEGAMVHTSWLASGLWSTSCIAQTAFVDGDYLQYRELASKRRFSRTTLDTADERYFIISMARTPEEVAFLLASLALSGWLQDKNFRRRKFGARITIVSMTSGRSE